MYIINIFHEMVNRLHWRIMDDLNDPVAFVNYVTSLWADARDTDTTSYRKLYHYCRK